MTRNCRLYAMLFVLACLSIFAPARLGAQMLEDMEPGQQPRFLINGAGLYLPSTHVSGGGDVSMQSYSLAARSQVPVNDRLNLGMGLSYQSDNYHFSKLTDFASPDPWGSVNTVGLNASVMYRLSPEWRFFAAPGGQYAGEDGADFGKSLVYGGTVGAFYRPKPGFTIGFGAGIFHRLDETSFFPAFIFSWKITDNLRLGNSSVTGPGGPAGLELAYKIDSNWETALAGGYHTNRFRLDSSGPVSNGIGEFDSWPLFVRLSRKLNQNLRLDLYGGAAVGGKLKLEDSRGHEIDRTSYKTAPLGGLTLTTMF